MPTDTPPIGPKQVHEIKWDGYRASIYVAEGKARSAPATAIRTRNGHDERFPAFAAAVAPRNVYSSVIDGEAVILDDTPRVVRRAAVGPPFDAGLEPSATRPSAVLTMNS